MLKRPQSSLSTHAFSAAQRPVCRLSLSTWEHAYLNKKFCCYLRLWYFKNLLFVIIITVIVFCYYLCLCLVPARECNHISKLTHTYKHKKRMLVNFEVSISFCFRSLTKTGSIFICLLMHAATSAPHSQLCCCRRQRQVTISAAHYRHIVHCIFS